MLYKPEKLSIVQPDTSEFALGIILKQLKDDKKLHLITFYSKQFTITEKNYNINNK